MLYDNIKVFRIPTGHNTSKLDTVVSQYQLNRWTERTLPNSHVDLEVPLPKLANFTNAINAILAEEGITQPIITMHEDLGVSIRQEFEGATSLSELKIQSKCSSFYSSLFHYPDFSILQAAETWHH